LYLSKEEEKMLAGEDGEATCIAMKILTKIGDIYNADKMIKIDNAHTNMTTYRNIMDAGVDILEKFAHLGAKYRIPTSLDIAGMDIRNWRRFNIPEKYAEKQMRIVDAQKKIGGVEMWTCTPYLHFNSPFFGQHIGWSESSAVIFANSVIGARTNRLSTVVDMAAGIVGLVPKFGLHLDENRRGNVKVKIKCTSGCLTDADYPVIGSILGEKVGGKVPVLEGIPRDVTIDQLKNMGAAAAATGSVALYHIPGITPEAKNIDDAFGGEKPQDTIEVDLKDIRDRKEQISTITKGKVDFVAVGCPHYSIREIRKIAALLEGKKIHKGVKFWIYTSRDTERVARLMGYASIIEASGAKIATDTCMVDSPTYLLGSEIMMTDSGKCAWYAPSHIKTQVIYGSTEECVNAAIRGCVE
jgi:predicted aconitase